MSLTHPHRRRLPRHARHLIRQMLRPRVAMRAGTLHVHAKQLDSAVNLREYPNRLHPDSDRHAPGVRVVVGPGTRSLLRQLLAARDMRVQQQLVREIVHQLQKRMVAAAKRAGRVKKAREIAGKAAKRMRAAGRRAGLWARLLGSRARLLGSWARSRVTGRTVRVVGNRTTTRTRHSTTTRTRAADSGGRAARAKPAAARTARARTTRT